jgi:CheY-like chemotaxis protein
MERRRKLLIVDDDEVSVETLEMVVENLGYSAETASTGKEALAKIGPHIDLVLMDVMMPEMNGFEVVKAIRQSLYCRDVPIIVITGIRHKLDRLRAFEVGANDVLEKPVDAAELFIRATSLLNVKQTLDLIVERNAVLEGTVTQLRRQLCRITQNQPVRLSDCTLVRRNLIKRRNLN